MPNSRVLERGTSTLDIQRTHLSFSKISTFLCEHSCWIGRRNQAFEHHCWIDKNFYDLKYIGHSEWCHLLTLSFEIRLWLNHSCLFFTTLDLGSCGNWKLCLGIGAASLKLLITGWKRRGLDFPQIALNLQIWLFFPSDLVVQTPWTSIFLLICMESWK